ncbi:MAG: site-specific DNA-methyltransferase [Alphaproteobacteria bacterium]|nr:site-specific DNA-methyltransferase [Alphaproteobacteria bacterium]
MTDLNVQFIPVTQLIPYARNARTHSEEQVSQIAGSIAEFGFVNPILMGDDNIIIAGHGRLSAAQRLGLKEVPTIILSHLTENQRRALIIADNKIALNAGWDEEMLRLELQELKLDDFNLELIGFSDEELNTLLIDGLEKSEGLTDENTVPELQEEAITKPGDVWILGNHRLLCGDSTLLTDVEKALGGVLADMVFTDPPYNVNYGGAMKDKLRGINRTIKNDNLGEEFEQFLYDACVNIVTVCKGAIYICMASSELDTLQSAFRKAGGHWSTFIIWAKNTFTLGRADYQRQYESILYGWKEGSDHYWCGARNQSDVWFFNKPQSNDLHPTMKPIELVERAIENSSKSRDIVLDCFGGSGSTLIAAEKTGRSARLIELDPKYCDVIVRRWQEFTGRDAIHEEEKQTFANLHTKMSQSSI